MKKTFLILAVAAFVFASCGSQTNEEAHEHNGETHMHEDGTMHENHDDMTQEEFQADSTHMPNDTATHHHNGEPHTH